MDWPGLDLDLDLDVDGEVGRDPLHQRHRRWEVWAVLHVQHLDHQSIGCFNSDGASSAPMAVMTRSGRLHSDQDR